MTFDVQVSEQADSDLRGIFEYISFELLAPDNAVGQLDRYGHKDCYGHPVMYGGRDVDKELERHTHYNE